MKTEIVNNRYEILKALGTGESSVVYKVRDLCSGEDIVLKLLFDHDEKQKQDFEREFLFMKEINHPFFPQTFDFGKDADAKPYFTMEYAEGPDLMTYFCKEKALDDLPLVLYSICLALRCLHHKGILHGDLKPKNIKVVSKNGCNRSVKVLDLGLARPFYSGEKTQFSGTVNYLAPEIVLGETVDQRADIYALGISLYEILSGELLYTGRKVEIMRKIVSNEIPSIYQARDDIPGDLADLIASMVALRPSDRPVDVEEVIKRVEEGFDIDSSVWKEALFVSPPMIGKDLYLENLSIKEVKDQSEDGVKIYIIVGGEGLGKTLFMEHLSSMFQVKETRTFWVGKKSESEHFASFKQIAKEIDPARNCEKDGLRFLNEIDYESVDLVISNLVESIKGKRIAFFLDNIEGIDSSSLIAIRLFLNSISDESPYCFVILNEEIENISNENLDWISSYDSFDNGLGSLLTGMRVAISSCKTVRMKRLSHQETYELIHGYLGEAPQGLDELVDELYNLTDGNKGLIKDLLIFFITNGILCFIKGRWLVNVIGLKEVKLQDKIDSLFSIKVSCMDEQETEILFHASVLGAEFNFDDLLGLMGGGSRCQKEALKQLLKRGDFISKIDRDSICFNGRILRDYFYQEAITKFNEERNLLEAHRCLKMLRSWSQEEGEEEFWIAKELGDVLFALRSFSDAMDEYRKAAVITEDDERFADQRPKIHLQIARSLIKLNALKEAESELMKVGEWLSWKEDTILMGKIQRELGWIHYQQGQHQRAHSYYRNALSIFRKANDDAVTPHLYNDIALLYQSLSKWQKADWWVKRALKMGQEIDDMEIIGNSMIIQGWGMKLRGHFKRGERYYKKALDLFREVKDYYGMSQVWNNIGELIREQGDLEQASEYLEKSLYIKEFLQNHIGVANSLSNLALIYRAMGKLKKSATYLEQSIKIRLKMGDSDGVSRIYGYLVETLIESEQWDNAKDVLELQSKSLKATESSYNRIYNRYLKGVFDLQMGFPDKAVENFKDTARSFGKIGSRESEARSRKDLACSFLQLGEPEEAKKEALKALKMSRTMKHPELTLESLLVVAKASEKEGSKNEVTKYYNEASQLFERTTFKTLKAKALFACAEHLYRKEVWQQRGKEAVKYDNYLLEAETLFKEIGIKSKLKDVRLLKRRVQKREQEIGSRELNTLYEASRIINSSLEKEVVLRKLMDLIISTMNVERGVIFIKDPVTSELVMEVARNVEHETIEDAKSFSSTILNNVKEKGNPIFIPDCSENESYSDAKSISRYSIMSIICIPLRRADEIIGTIYIDDRRTSHFFNDRDVDFLLSLGDIAALAIHNAQLYEELEVANKRLREETLDLRRQVRVRSEFQGMVGRHEKMQILYQVIEKVAQTDAGVLIRGENGSGKELVARAIHYLSKRRDNPFVIVNCAAIPETLLESEIFGIEKGTATGVSKRVGKFEQANEGTLFLDEIGDMSPAIQAKILRVLQEKQFQRLGGRQNIAVDVKILAATNKDLESDIQEGRFREDLYYRLNVLPIIVPPLRDRKEDIPLFVEYFLRNWSEENDRDLPRVSKGILRVFEGYQWPGNVRQLKNIVERMALLSSGGVLRVEDIPPEVLIQSEDEWEGSESLKSLREMQRKYVMTVFNRCGKNKKKTCHVLGITYKTLQSYLS
jgi:Nif-specific regulatory protein